MRKATNLKPLPEVIPFGTIIMLQSAASALPLEKTTITGQVRGALVVVSITQHFSNPLTEVTELEYLFPLPHKAAIVDFSFSLPERTIHAEVRESEKARQEYDQALLQGQQAALLEARRPNLFAVRLANVRPGKAIQTTIRYQETMPYRDGDYELVIPMGLTPKYTSPSHPDEGKGVDAPIAHPGENIGPVELSLAIDAGAPLGDLISPSHALRFTRLDERRINLTLAQPAIPDHDFVLRLPVSRDSLKIASFLSKNDGGDVFYASILPPPASGTELEPEPREFIFVLDRSGSMSGEPIAQACNALRACMRILNPSDTFNVLLFDHEIEWYKPAAIAINQQNVDEADQFLNGIEGRGGTEILAAIQAALHAPVDKERTRYVLFLTDGAVSAEERALAEARKKLGKARLFTMGIGPSVNRALLQKLARVGRGTSEFLQLNEDIEGAILRLQDRISFPAVTDLELSCENGRIWDCYPSILPDVFTGEPLEIVGRVKPTSAHKPPRLVLHGKRSGQPVVLDASLVALPEPEPAISRAWARARVDDLEEQAALDYRHLTKVRDEIISLALEYRLVTQYTSFVAVDTPVVNPTGKSKLIHIAQPLPEGLDLAGFTGAPMMAMKMALPSAPAAPRSRLFNAPIADASISFDKMVASPDDLDDSFMMREVIINHEAPPVFDMESTLRGLARTQNLDGSWPEGEDFTSLALLCFARDGRSSQARYFRHQVKRAVNFISQAHLTGMAAFMAALAMKELAATTGSAEHQRFAGKLISQLSPAASRLENVVYALIQDQPLDEMIPDRISTLDDLWIAGLTGTSLTIPGDLFKGKDAEIVRLLAILMNNA